MLNDYELANIALIVDYETAKGYRESEARYVGGVMDYMISDIIDQNIKVDGIAVFASMGLEDGNYCSVTGYVYYDEYDTLMMDVSNIEVW